MPRWTRPRRCRSRPVRRYWIWSGSGCSTGCRSRWITVWSPWRNVPRSPTPTSRWTPSTRSCDTRPGSRRRTPIARWRRHQRAPSSRRCSTSNLSSPVLVSRQTTFDQADRPVESSRHRLSGGPLSFPDQALRAARSDLTGLSYWSSPLPLPGYDGRPMSDGLQRDDAATPVTALGTAGSPRPSFDEPAHIPYDGPRCTCGGTTTPAAWPTGSTSPATRSTTWCSRCPRGACSATPKASGRYSPRTRCSTC